MEPYFLNEILLGVNVFTVLLSLNGLIKSARNNDMWMLFFAPLGGVATACAFHQALQMAKLTFITTP